MDRTTSFSEKRRARAALAWIALAAAGPALADGTPAGTSIDNVATATFDGPGGSASVTSNMVSLRVDELLGVVVATADAGPVSAGAGASGAVLRFQVTNAGNGAEAFALAFDGGVGGDDFDPQVTSLVVDANGNGAYDAGIDTPYVAGSNDPVLAPDASVAVFLLSTMPAGGADAARGFARLTATAATGSGTPGTSFAGSGQGGGDALVGATGARAGADGIYAISAASVTFVKSAVVADPFGGARAVPGSVIVYRLVATLSGGGSLANLRIADAIPAGTTYRAGSLQLDGAGLTDAADADGGRFADGGIQVTLAAAAAGSSHAVSFEVTIN